jgi:hypothetical protein
LEPGQEGTKVLVERYGEDFVCVRYRYIESSRTWIKIVGHVVERKFFPPSPRKIHDDDVVPVLIAYEERNWAKWPGLLANDGMRTFG